MNSGERSHNFSPHSTPAATFARGLMQETNPPPLLAALLIGSGRLHSDLATRPSG